MKQVLNEFKKSEKLRPIKICVYYPENQSLETDSILKELSQQYRIPLITMQSILDDALAA